MNAIKLYFLKEKHFARIQAVVVFRYTVKMCTWTKYFADIQIVSIPKSTSDQNLHCLHNIQPPLLGTYEGCSK